MKDAIARILLSKEFQLSMAGVLLRRFLIATKGAINYSPKFLMDAQAFERSNYAYCMFGAAAQARRRGESRISVLEFGVGDGDGLAFMCEMARAVTKRTGVTVSCYGFDTGAGRPAPEGPKDLPYWFRETQTPLDEAKLRARAPEATLVIGDFKETVPAFLENHDPAPIGAMFIELDYWSSTRDALALLESAATRPQNFLPRIFVNLEHILGWEHEMYGAYNGQLAALNEFNASQEDVKIHLNQNLMAQLHLRYRMHIYYAHLFAHPDYDKFVRNTRGD